MKHFRLISLMIMAMSTMAFASNNKLSVDNGNQPVNIETSYLDRVYTGGGWDANWFVTAQGGFSLFSGKPVGHGDLFDRTEPMLNLAVGKWITPTVGIRLAFQGMNFKDCNTDRHSMQNFHADILYNLSYLFRDNMEQQPRWNVMPLAGIGLIHNSFYRQRPFAMTFGVNIGYRLTERLMLSAEAANSVTFQDFDGTGDDNRLGDHFIQANVGLTYTIGKVGWKRIVDAQPYILANDLLNERLRAFKEENERLRLQHQNDMIKLEDCRLIADIGEEETTEQQQEIRVFPKNNYRGLNALRERIRQKNSKNNDSNENASQLPEFVNTDSFMAYKTADNREVKGYPIYFFFKKGTTVLTDKNQMVNIREIAKAMTTYHMSAVAVGAADAATGTVEINKRLSARRAEYLAAQLTKNGVPQEDIIKESRGGIEDYTEPETNRNCLVLLCPKP